MDGISAMVGYIYDADGNRVAKGPITSWSCDPTTNGFESSAYETDYVLNQSGQTVTETTKSDTGVMQWNFTNVYANGVLFATYDAQGLHFLLNDWLGTRRASTDYEGVLESLCASLPYGDQLNCTNSPQSPNEQHFTGKQHDQESGNDYFGARYYSENDARFMSPDWSAKVEPVPYAKMDDPQSLNLYGYMLDRPLDGVDQDGHWGWGAFTDITARISIYLAEHPAVEAGLEHAASSVGIRAFAGVGGKLGDSNTNLNLSAGFYAQTNLQGRGSAGGKATAGARILGAGVSGSAQIAAEKNGHLVNPIHNINASASGSITGSPGKGASLNAQGNSGTAAVGVSIKTGIFSGALQVTADTMQLSEALANAIVTDTTNFLRKVEKANSCSGGNPICTSENHP